MGLSRGSRHGNDLTKIGGQSGQQIVGRTSSCMYLRFSISYHMIYILRLDPFGHEMISCLDPLRRLKTELHLITRWHPLLHKVDGSG